MRRLLILALLLVAALAMGQVYYESTPTLEWDAVTTDSDGNPFLPGDVVEYEVFIWDMAQGDIALQPPENLTTVGTTSDTTVPLGFPSRTEWAIAVRTKHTDGGGNVSYSELAYSTQELHTLAGPFWYVPVLTWVPQRPTGLRDSGM